MEKIINFNGIEVPVVWYERLKPYTEVYVHTPDSGLAMNIIELFLDEMGKRNLWYEDSWPAYEDYQEMTLIQCDEECWKSWSREFVLSKTNDSNKKNQLC